MNQRVLKKSLAMISPRTRQALEHAAARRGASVEDVFLDEMIEAAGPLRDQLFALRRRERLRAVN